MTFTNSPFSHTPQLFLFSPTPANFAWTLFSIPLGITDWRQWLCKIFGVDKVHYGLCENGELRAYSWAISSTKQENHYTSLLKMSFILTAEKKKPYSLKLATMLFCYSFCDYCVFHKTYSVLLWYKHKKKLMYDMSLQLISMFGINIFYLA